MASLSQRASIQLDRSFLTGRPLPPIGGNSVEMHGFRNDSQKVSYGGASTEEDDKPSSRVNVRLIESPSRKRRGDDSNKIVCL
ncbi:unnamed protein product [Sphagnum balticum]